VDNKITYALEGSVFMAGAAIQWLRDNLQIIKTAAASEAAAEKLKDNDGVYFVPAFSGLGAPYWDMNVRGTLSGLTQGSSANHIIRATLESIAYQSKDVLAAMERDSGVKLAALNVDGGATANNFLMQFQADILPCPVCRAPVHPSLNQLLLGLRCWPGLLVAFGQWLILQEAKKDLPALSPRWMKIHGINIMRAG